MTSKPLARNAMYTLLCAAFATMAGCSQAPAPAQNPASATTAATPASTQPTAATQAALYTPPSADQLYQLVAPIALFPDNLVAQVLAGSTYPDQLAAADTLLTRNPGLKGDALWAQVNPQPWDASIKALTTFPSVLDQMARNPQWSSALGEAYVNDPTDVMNAIQVMRQRAAQKGNLRSNAQQVVQTRPAALPAATGYATEDQGSAYYDGPSVVQAPPQTIEIMPAQQDVVYVPGYDPQTVYGGDVPSYPGYRYPPGGYSTGEIVTAGAITFGAGILIGSLLESHHDHNYNPPPPPGGGWHSWGMNWGGRDQGNAPLRPAVIYDNTTYVSRSTTVVNRYATNNINNINNSRTTISNIDNSRPQVVQSSGVGSRAVNNRSSLPASRPPGAMSMPHFGNVPRQETVRTQPARAPAHAPNTPGPVNALVPHAGVPHVPPAHVASEPTRGVRPKSLAPPQPPPREAVRPMPPHVTPAHVASEPKRGAPLKSPTPPQPSPPREAVSPMPPHATPAARSAAISHVEARPVTVPREAAHPAAPQVEAAPRPALSQHPKAVAPAHPAHPAAPGKKDKHDNDGHS